MSIQILCPFLNGIVWFLVLSCMSSLYILFYFYFLNFIYVWLRWVFIAACGLSLVASGGYSCSAWASHCGGFSCCGAWTLGTWASVVAARGLSSCGTRALELTGFSSCGTWALGHEGSVVVARRI